MYKAIFIDIDGTLRTDDKITTPRTKAAVEACIAKGIRMVLCTGRVRGYALRVAEECGIKSGYIITSSGAEIYNLDTKQAFYSARMTPVSCARIAKLAQKHDIRFNFNADGMRYVDQLYRNDGLETLIQKDIKELASEHVMIQGLLRSHDFDTMKAIRPDLENIAGTRIINAAKSLNDPHRPPEEKVHYDIVSNKASKGIALRKLCQFLKIKTTDTIGIGDDFNDLEMFEAVGLSVSMGSAGDLIQSLTDIVIGDNNFDGVAIYLEELLLTNFAK